MEENKKKKKKLTPKWFVIKLSGICFAAYAVYYLRMIITYGGEMETKGIVVTALVAWLFGILSVFAWSSEARNSQMAAIRRMVLIVALAGIFALRTCMIGQVIGFLDPDKPYTLLYGASYVLMQAALVILFIFYFFILQHLMFYPRASVVLPVIAAIAFFGGLVMEAVLFFAFRMLIEPSFWGSILFRPAFYLGFIGLSVYFLFPMEFSPELPPEFPPDE